MDISSKLEVEAMKDVSGDVHAVERAAPPRSNWAKAFARK